ALGAPQLLAVLLVQGHEEGLLVVVALDEEAIPFQDRRAAGAPAKLHLVGAEVLVPELLAFEAEAVHAAVGAKVGIDTFAIGDRRLGSVGVAHRRRDGRLLLSGKFLPEPLAVVAVDAVALPAIDDVRRSSAAEPATAGPPATRPPT